MAHSASNLCQGVGRGVAYTVYNLGVGILLEFARLVVATYYLCKQYFYKEEYNKAAAQAPLSENRFIRWFQETARGLADLGMESLQNAKIKKWKGEALRGLIGLIPLFGTAYLTAMDNPCGGRRKVSLFGIKELGEMIKHEYEYDKMTRDVLKNMNYDYSPIDLRLQELLRT